MKKILIFGSLLVFAVACVAPTTNRETAPTSNANSSPARSSAPLTETEAIATEKLIWDMIRRKDYNAFGNMLTDDFIDVASDAVYDKAGSISSMKGFEPGEITFSDWKFVPIDKDAGVITYTVNIKGKYNGEELPPTPVRASSVFVNRDGKWLGIYHQGSEVMKMPPPPPAAASKTKAAASPAPTPALAETTSDPIANEKAVWAALKTKNYDGFASYLAPEAIEVESSGVYDKADSVKGVQGFDASKADLSEFKTIKIDDDASIVTYTVKIPGAKPDTERHTTIWVNRNGKWLALFHQGTPVMPMPAVKPSPSASPSKAAATSSPVKPEGTSSPKTAPTRSPAKPAATKSPGA
jgi:hypothetical protein